MPDTYKFIISALYVTFTYACIAIGALVYRQVIDNANQRTVTIGEELYQLFDPRVFAGIGILFFFFSIFVAALFTKEDVLHEEVNRSAPGLLFFVVPMIIVVNIIQIYLRGRWQRTSIRTQGILVRRIFSEQLFTIMYEHLELVEVEDEALWFTLRFHTMIEQEQSYVCWVSKKGLKRLLSTISNHSGCSIEMRGQKKV